MKDSIVNKFPDVLAILLNSTCARYGKAGVNYIEYSVSCGDLLDPRKFKAMITKTFTVEVYNYPVQVRKAKKRALGGASSDPDAKRLRTAGAPSIVSSSSAQDIALRPALTGDMLEALCSAGGSLAESHNAEKSRLCPDPLLRSTDTLGEGDHGNYYLHAVTKLTRKLSFCTRFNALLTFTGAMLVTSDAESRPTPITDPALSAPSVGAASVGRSDVGDIAILLDTQPASLMTTQLAVSAVLLGPVAGPVPAPPRTPLVASAAPPVAPSTSALGSMGTAVKPQQAAPKAAPPSAHTNGAPAPLQAPPAASAAPPVDPSTSALGSMGTAVKPQQAAPKAAPPSAYANGAPAPPRTPLVASAAPPVASSTSALGSMGTAVKPQQAAPKAAPPSADTNGAPAPLQAPPAASAAPPVAPSTSALGSMGTAVKPQQAAPKAAPPSADTNGAPAPLQAPPAASAAPPVASSTSALGSMGTAVKPQQAALNAIPASPGMDPAARAPPVITAAVPAASSVAAACAAAGDRHGGSAVNGPAVPPQFAAQYSLAPSLPSSSTSLTGRSSITPSEQRLASDGVGSSWQRVSDQDQMSVEGSSPDTTDRSSSALMDDRSEHSSESEDASQDEHGEDDSSSGDSSSEDEGVEDVSSSAGGEVADVDNKVVKKAKARYMPDATLGCTIGWHQYVDHMDKPKHQKFAFLAAFTRDKDAVYHTLNKQGCWVPVKVPVSHAGAYEKLGDMACDIKAMSAFLAPFLDCDIQDKEEIHRVRENFGVELQVLCEGSAPICHSLRALAKVLCRDEFIAAVYPKLLGENAKVNALRAKITGADPKDAGIRLTYVQAVAGLDWVGDELGHPFCIFSHDAYVSLVAEWMGQDPTFGVRIHAAEGPIRPSTVEGHASKLRLTFYLHMYILTEGIKLYHKKLTAKLHDMGLSHLKPRVRIGHGVAFLWGSDNPESEHWFDKHMKEFRGFLRDNEIVCELSPTSNHMLLASTFHSGARIANRRTLRCFLDEQLPVVLSTDDDGIWAIHKCKCHYRHISVAAEYCRAIECGDIRTESELQEMLWWGRYSAFCKPGKKGPDGVPDTVQKRRDAAAAREAGIRLEVSAINSV
jgi:adenosine deaminase